MAETRSIATRTPGLPDAIEGGGFGVTTVAEMTGPQRAAVGKVQPQAVGCVLFDQQVTAFVLDHGGHCHAGFPSLACHAAIILGGCTATVHVQTPPKPSSDGAALC